MKTKVVRIGNICVEVEMNRNSITIVDAWDKSGRSIRNFLIKDVWNSNYIKRNEFYEFKNLIRSIYG